MKKAELIAFLQNNLQLDTRPTRPPPPPPTWEPIDDRPSVRFGPDRPRQNVMPGSRDMDIFEQQKMRKNRPQVPSKLNDWHDWLVNHVPKTIKDKVMGLYNRVKGEKNTNTSNELNERETRINLIEDQTRRLKPYLLKPKRSKETFIEPPMKQPPSNSKQIKHMKKKLGKLSKKIRHSKKKHNNLIFNET